jgi:hypothetical protein
MFKKDQIYSTNEIVNEWGGNVNYSMPLVNGAVPYCKFKPKLNPNFILKNEIWVEQGPMREKGANILLSSATKIPVFEKIKTGSWRYKGKFVFKKINDKKRLNQINKNPPRRCPKITCTT